MCFSFDQIVNTKKRMYSGKLYVYGVFGRSFFDIVLAEKVTWKKCMIQRFSKKSISLFCCNLKVINYGDLKFLQNTYSCNY